MIADGVAIPSLIVALRHTVTRSEALQRWLNLDRRLFRHCCRCWGGSKTKIFVITFGRH